MKNRLRMLGALMMTVLMINFCGIFTFAEEGAEINYQDTGVVVLFADPVGEAD